MLGKHEPATHAGRHALLDECAAGTPGAVSWLADGSSCRCSHPRWSACTGLGSGDTTQGAD
jgi:hypothetical protein